MTCFPQKIFYKKVAFVGLKWYSVAIASVKECSCWWWIFPLLFVVTAHLETIALNNNITHLTRNVFHDTTAFVF
jgi:hypothetical protein